MTHTFEIEEEERQMVLLAIAILAIVRPGFAWALGEVAEKLQGRPMFEAFKQFNEDQYKPRVVVTDL